MEQDNNTDILIGELLGLMPPTRRGEPSKHENLVHLLERIHGDQNLLPQVKRLAEIDAWNATCRVLNGGDGSSGPNGLDVN